MTKTYYLYILHDPTLVSQTYYIGYSQRPQERLNAHRNDFESNKYKTNWLRKLEKRILTPETHLFASFNAEEEAWAAEIDMIAFCRSVGIKTCNILPGGNSPPRKSGEE